MNKRELTATTKRMVELAMNLVAEGEPLVIDDIELSVEDMVTIRAHLSRQRKAIDMVNKAMAVYWDETYPGAVFEEEFTKWGVKTAAGKRIIDDTTFFEWLASKSAIELSKLVSATAIKVGGMSPAERDSLLDESSTNANKTITSSRRY